MNPIDRYGSDLWDFFVNSREWNGAYSAIFRYAFYADLFVGFIFLFCRMGALRFTAYARVFAHRRAIGAALG